MSAQNGIRNPLVERANDTHIDDVTKLFDAYRVFYQQPSDPAAARAFVDARLQKKDSVIFLASAELDGKRVALGFTQLYPAYSSVSMKRLWILNDLYVDKRARHQGIARALIDRAKQLAWDTEAKGLILETAIDNHEAQALYDSYGFEKDTEFFRYNLDV